MRETTKRFALPISAMCLAFAAGCDDGAPTPAAAASPPAAASTPAAMTPVGETGAAGGASITPATATPAAASTPSAQGSARGNTSATQPTAAKPIEAAKPEPPATLPVGPGIGKDAIATGRLVGKRIVPIDERAAAQSVNARPVSGGTLIVTKDNSQAVAADPERDRVSIVDLTWGIAANIALQAGDEPGRLVQDDAGLVHVVLRGAGAVASIDLKTQKLVSRRAVCTAPRGIAFDAASKSLKVACTAGEIATLPAAGGEVSGRVMVAPDIRDVVVTPTGTFVSRLKSAELIALDANGNAKSTARAAEESQLVSQQDGSQLVDTVTPLAARRTVRSIDGGMIMLHQGARNGEIEVKPPSDDIIADERTGAQVGSSAYGGAGGCDGVSTTHITRFGPDGQVKKTMRIQGTLVVDVAESSTGEIAVAVAGAPDPMQPPTQILPVNPDGTLAPSPIIDGPQFAEGEVPQTLSVMTFNPQQIDQQQVVPQFKGGPGGCANISNVVPLPVPATAVAYAGAKLIVQTREPAAVHVASFDDPNVGFTLNTIKLGGISVQDTGHDIFHRDAGAGVACASCHLEGGDDGHVWHFVDQGPRRTQSMLIGLEGTAPFHWVGDMTDLTKLMENVFVGRMGGVHQSPARLKSLESWLYGIKAPPALRAATDAAVERGHAIFEGEAECNKCHTGPKLTNNETVDVGTGVALQVPSLVAVGYRGPWIHTGCAKTLRERFDPACGGDKHGKVAQLADAQVDDLVSYLESL